MTTRPSIEGWVDGARSVDFTIPLQPVPCPRPRVTRAGFSYYPANYKVWKRDAAEYVPEVYPLLDGPVLVMATFVLPPFKTVDRDVPKGDVDNYLKSVLDLITSTNRVWDDDIQVNVAHSTKRFTADGEEPHTYVHIREGVKL